MANKADAKLTTGKAIAKMVSVLALPFTTLLFAVVWANRGEIGANPSYFYVFVVVGFFPPITVYFFELLKYKKNILQYISISQKGRTPIFATAVASFSISYGLFNYEQLNNEIWLNNSIIISIYFAIFFIVNKFLDKASQHSAAFIFAVVYLSHRIDDNILLALMAVPLIYWARIKLHKHTWNQLILGSIIGGFVGLLSWNI